MRNVKTNGGRKTYSLMNCVPTLNSSRGEVVSTEALANAGIKPDLTRWEYSSYLAVVESLSQTCSSTSRRPVNKRPASMTLVLTDALTEIPCCRTMILSSIVNARLLFCGSTLLARLGDPASPKRSITR